MKTKDSAGDVAQTEEGEVLPKEVTHPAGTVELVAINELHESKRNLRTYDAESLASLAENIRRKGILVPLVVRPRAQGGYEIGAGHRRFRAARIAGATSIPVIVREMDDDEFIELLTMENLHHEGLHPLDEAAGFLLLSKLKGYSIDRIAARTGKDRSYVYDRLKFNDLKANLQEEFRADRFELGHAIELSRLTPSEQQRAHDINGALYTHEHSLWGTVKHAVGPADRKPTSVREFKDWIARHVRFDHVKADPQLFPETLEAVAQAAAEKQKVIPITHDHQLQPETRDKARTFGPMSWRQADGKGKHKKCEYSALGVFVAGQDRGETLEVCVRRDKCTVHFGKEIRAKAQRASGKAKPGKPQKKAQWQLDEEKRARERAARDIEVERWKKSAPAILKALADRIDDLPTKPGALLGKLLIGELTDAHDRKQISKYMRREPKTVDDLVRYLAFALLFRAVSHAWSAVEEFPKVAKALSIDLKKIIDQEAPPVQEPSAPPAGEGAEPEDDEDE